MKSRLFLSITCGLVFILSILTASATEEEKTAKPYGYVGASFLYFTGIDADHDLGTLELDDSEAFSIQLGYIFAADEVRTHSVELEIAILETEGNDSISTIPVDVEVDAIPFWANYRYQQNINDKLVVYAGAGLGMAFIDAKVEAAGVGVLDEKDEILTTQVFFGMGYNLSRNINLYAGYRTIYFGEADKVDGIRYFDSDMSQVFELRMDFSL